jgi:hypothetical protein
MAAVVSTAAVQVFQDRVLPGPGTTCGGVQAMFDNKVLQLTCHRSQKRAIQSPRHPFVAQPRQNWTQVAAGCPLSRGMTLFD